VWAVAPTILVLGVGMGACISSICDVAIAFLDLGLVWLLPKTAPPEQH
jgi:hypothetical protein